MRASLCLTISLICLALFVWDTKSQQEHQSQDDSAHGNKSTSRKPIRKPADDDDSSSSTESDDERSLLSKIRTVIKDHFSHKIDEINADRLIDSFKNKLREVIGVPTHLPSNHHHQQAPNDTLDQ